MRWSNPFHWNPKKTVLKYSQWMSLTDFGYSREKPSDQSGFFLTNHLGTSGFIAPELLSTKVPSLASDVWSYGAVFFYVVSNGQQPHDVPDLRMDLLRDFVY